MSELSRPIIQHWVPRFYLRHFATPQTLNGKSPRVWLWDKQRGMHPQAPTAVKNVLGERHLYSPETPSGERDWAAEELLNDTETAASKLWSSVLAMQVSLRDPEIRRPLARFIGLLHLRNVRVRDLIQSTMVLRDQLFGPVTQEQLAMRASDMPDPNHPARFFSHTVINGDERMTKNFGEDLSWFAFHSEEDVFITTDCPVQFLQGGPGRPNSAAAFPLSPRLLLVMQNIRNDSPAAFVNTPMERCRVYNMDMYTRCARFVITGRPIRDVLHELGVSAA